MPIASTPEQLALQDALRDWAKRIGAIGLVRARESRETHDSQQPAMAPVDLAALGVFSILSPDDIKGSVPDLAAGVEQLAASLVPGAIMPALLASAITNTHPAPTAVALQTGTLVATRTHHGEVTVSGETGPVLGASEASGLVVAAEDDQWFIVAPGAKGVTITPLAPLDFSRELATVHFDNATVRPLPGITTQTVHTMAATMFAAEAAGVAQWCAATAVEYAKTRRQFGRLIGEFQAVKHLCATMYCRAERAAAVAWGAARAPHQAQELTKIALNDAVDNAKDCIQVLGGIGFTWEHDAHLYLRRAIANRQLCTVTKPPRTQPPRTQQTTREARDIGVGAWAAPAIEQYGTKAQQDKFVSKTRNGEITWCQLFSEPEAGSDLAGLKTRAIKDHKGWRLTGQKVWTSLARTADWAICLARTDPDVPRHKGLTYFLVDMHAAGIEVRPLREITGRSVFNEVFLDDVLVPDDCVLGAPGDGWRVAMSTLATERERIGSGDPVVALLEERGAHPAVRKLIGVERRQERAEAELAKLGPYGAQAGTEQAHEFLLTRCLSIAGGTTQILLNQVAERILGLPRDH